MADFEPLPISGGVGDIHLNRFRIGFVCPDDVAARLARNLWNAFPSYLDPDYATVEVDSHSWNGRPALRFKGVASFAPFYDPLEWGWVQSLMPDFTKDFSFRKARDWMMPDWVHHDHVGVVSESNTGFTVQTLKRKYWDPVDGAIVTIVVLQGPLPSTYLEGYMINMNRSHFLAGRRSFRIYKSPDNSRYFFETAAVERFSHRAYQASQIIVGDFTPIIKGIWTSMVTKFCAMNGLTPLQAQSTFNWQSDGSRQVEYVQHKLSASPSAVSTDVHWSEMARIHDQVFDW